MTTLGDVIGGAHREWDRAQTAGVSHFEVDGRNEKIERFDVLLLSRLAENGFVVAAYQRVGPHRLATILADMPAAERRDGPARP